MQQTPGDYRLIALFDRLASIGRAVRRVREQKETGLSDPVAKRLTQAGQMQTDKQTTRRKKDSTPRGGSRQD